MIEDPEKESDMLLYTMSHQLINAILAYYIVHPIMDGALMNRIRAVQFEMDNVAKTWQDASLRPLLAQLVLSVETVDDEKIQGCVLRGKSLLQETPIGEGIDEQ